jgi:hypothetical protein
VFIISDRPNELIPVYRFTNSFAKGRLFSLKYDIISSVTSVANEISKNDRLCYRLAVLYRLSLVTSSLQLLV